MEVRKVERRLIENANGMFTVPPRRIVYAYSEYQPLFDVMKRTIPNIIFHQGLPDREDLENHSEGLDHVILVLSHVENYPIGRLRTTLYGHFTSSKHHCSLSDANLYPPGKYARSISLNCANVIFFRNERETRGSAH